MAVESDKTFETWRKTQEYKDVRKQNFASFAALIVQTGSSSYPSLTLPDYSNYQAEAFAAGLAVVISPDILRQSQCNHRAVAACFVQHYAQRLPKETASEMLKIGAIMGRNVAVLPTEHDGDYLFIHGTNNWQDLRQARLPEENLDCKLLPGLPQEVPANKLRFLPPDQRITSLLEVDRACPKRTQGLNCNIIHAEQSAIFYAVLFRKLFNLPSPEKSFLTSTWVPCRKCVGLLLAAPELIGNRLDVFSVYGAKDDVEDEQMARAVRMDLTKSDLGYLAGPLIDIDKTDGYGWIPATREGLALLSERAQAEVDNSNSSGSNRELFNFLIGVVDVVRQFQFEDY